MGLYAHFNPRDYGFQEVIEAEVEGEVISEEVDYTEACEEAVNTFLEIANDLVPVDTGYLQSTIDASTDGWEVEFEATAEYAQYPEYGTWCQDAQPYFRPALQEAISVFIELARTAEDEAKEIVSEQMQAIMDAAQEAMGFALGTVFGTAFLLLMFPLMLYEYGIIQTIFAPIMGTDEDRQEGLYAAAEELVEIT